MKPTFKKIVGRIIDIYLRTKRVWVVAVIIVFALVVLHRFLWATETFGIGIRTDSVAYLWSSENLVKGIGLGRLDGAGNFRPYTHWPPLYPIVLSIPRLMGFDGMESARIIGAICVTLLIIVTGSAISRLTNHSPFYTAGALIILINAPNLWDTSLFAMSETLYMVLSLSALLLLAGYLNNFKSYLLILSSLLAGLAIITRYVGFSVITASLLVILIQKERSWSQRIRDSFIMLGISMFPLIFWMIRNILVAGTSTNRTLALIPFTLGEIQKAVSTMYEWVDAVIRMSPVDWLKPALLFTVAFLTAIIYFKVIPAQGNSRRNWFWALLLVYALSYTVITIMARLLFDQYIPLFEPRIQYPLFTSIFLLLIFGLYQLQEHARTTGWLIPAILTGLYVLGTWGLSRAYTQILIGRSDGILFTARNQGLGMPRYKNDPLLSVYEQYPLSENRYFTDNIEKLYYVSSLYSYQLLSSQPEQIARIQAELSDYNVMVVLYDHRSWGLELQSMIPGLELIYSGTADVYSVPSR